VANEHGGHEGVADINWYNVVWLIIDAALFFGATIWFTRKMIVAFFSERRRSIAAMISDARAARASAESKKSEAEKRVANVEQELAQLRTQTDASLAEEQKQREQATQAALTRHTAEVDELLRIEQAVHEQAMRARVLANAFEQARTMTTAQVSRVDHERLFTAAIAAMQSAAKAAPHGRGT
jgi:F-type H+-transporting ATPase subunit b